MLLRYTIQSRKLGRPITFTRPEGSVYVWVDVDRPRGTLGQQCCEHGYFSGSTLTYHGEDATQFAILCRRWWQGYLRRA